MSAVAEDGVSVVVAAYQSAAWIGETLASIAAQTRPAAEIIVVDDGSSDGTGDVAERAGARVIRQTNAGPSSARNTGIRAAAGRWVAFCDADDLWEPQRLARHAQADALCPDVVMTFSDYVHFDAGGIVRGGTMLSDPEYRRVRRRAVAPGIVRCDDRSLCAQLYRSNMILTSTAVVRRDAVLAIGGFDEALRIAEDFDLFLRLLARGGAAVVEEPLVRYRTHASNISSDIVANTESHRALWQRVSAAPERYPAGAQRFVREDPIRQRRAAGEYAMRVGRFAEARTLLQRSLHERPAMPTAALLLAAVALDSAPGRSLHGTARTLWRRRWWRYARRRDDLAAGVPAQRPRA